MGISTSQFSRQTGTVPRPAAAVTWGPSLGSAPHPTGKLRLPRSGLTLWWAGGDCSLVSSPQKGCLEEDTLSHLSFSVITSRLARVFGQVWKAAGGEGLGPFRAMPGAEWG